METKCAVCLLIRDPDDVDAFSHEAETVVNGTYLCAAHVGEFLHRPASGNHNDRAGYMDGA